MCPVIPSSKSELQENLKLTCLSLIDKKAEDLKLLYFGEKSPLTDCFIIATGTSDPHLKALRDNLEKTLKEHSVETLSKERFKPGGWLILDGLILWFIFSLKNNGKITHLSTSGKTQKRSALLSLVSNSS